MDNNPKAQVIERLREAQNILITVSDNPWVDQLSAAIGFTLMLNKLNKHATAVFSGQIPSTLEFLKPEETLEQTIDSLRDFIISLDKSKADKLRYKVEEDVVRIFITPFRTHLTENDLDFSQGDYNVEVVVALGVDQREHIDKAIMAHGRILHDATVIGLMAGDKPVDVGGINWQEPSASSLCEMLVGTSESFKKGLLDSQMATAFLTGIVAETERFSNDKTSPKVMTMSAQLMAAGANQQLIATKLIEEPEVVEDPIEEGYRFEELPVVVDEEPESERTNENEGVISLHGDSFADQPENEAEDESGLDSVKLFEPAPAYEEPLSTNKNPLDQIHIDTHGTLHRADSIPQAGSDLELSERDTNFNRGIVVEPLTEAEKAKEPGAPHIPISSYINEPPAMGGTLTANSTEESANESLEKSSDPLSNIPQSTYPAPDIPTAQNFDQYTVKPSVVSPLPTQQAKPAASEFNLESVLQGIDPTPKIETPAPSNDMPVTPAHFNTDAIAVRPLGPNVDTNDTLASIEDTIKDFSNARPSDNMVDQDAARRAVLEATSASGDFDENRPEPTASVGAQYVPLGSEPQPMLNTQQIDYEPSEEDPPSSPPPFPMPPSNGPTMPLPE